MVKVEIDYRGKGISKILVKGHANTAPYGQDLVCAAVSAICTGALNALEDSDSYSIELESGYIKCEISGSISEHDQTVLETMIIQLKTIEVSYAGTINIKERK